MDNFPRIPKPAGRWPELAEVITPHNVEFIGEQGGPAEERFKARMSYFFGLTPNIIKRAYLARLTCDESPGANVVLCLRHIDSVEHELRRGFRHMFGELRRRGDSYDHMVIDEEQEQKLKKVCKPFYELA